VADGNVHLVVGKRNRGQQLTDQINDLVYGPLKDLGGSISAEHGIGQHKKHYLYISRTDQEIQLMKTLKQTMDPRNILNPGKII